MNTLLFKCPDCAQQMQLPEAMIGQKGECPNCSEVIVPIPVLGSLSQEQASPPKPAADLPVEPEPPPAVTDDGASSDEPEGKEVDSEKTRAETECDSVPENVEKTGLSRGSNFLSTNPVPAQTGGDSETGTRRTTIRRKGKSPLAAWWTYSDLPREMRNMAFSQQNLTDGEAILHIGRFHSINWGLRFVGYFPAYLLLGLLLFRLFTVVTMEVVVLGAPFFCCMLVYMRAVRAYSYNKVYKTEFVLTNKRLITKKGFFQTVAREIQLPKVESVDYGQTFFERWYGVGRLTVRGTGGGKVGKFTFLLDALEFRKQILDQIDKASTS